MEILQAIGGTSLVRLRRVVPPDCAEIYVKLEWENPTGANVLAAIDVGRRLGAGARVVTLLCDSGLKYLHTDVFRTR